MESSFRLVRFVRVFSTFSFNNIFIPISINRANFFKIFSISLLVGETLSLFLVFPWLRMGEPGRGCKR
ncbi:hypothetical protein D7S42_06660 [Corynebacterium striatum]|nr:hypothetical protein D7S42_06660 [Corynebacterium striatum]